MGQKRSRVGAGGLSRLSDLPSCEVFAAPHAIERARLGRGATSRAGGARRLARLPCDLRAAGFAKGPRRLNRRKARPAGVKLARNPVLDERLAEHPNVGEIRGLGLVRALPALRRMGFDTLAAGAVALDYLSRHPAVDRERIVQLVNNLVGNAVKFNPPGGSVAVRILDEADSAVIEVSDSGPGIPPDELPRIFDRFYRIEGGLASGSGLGLAIARELAERMGGTLEVRSQRGETVFTLRLQAAAVPARAPELLAG